MDKFEALREYFGYTEFRDGQEELIDAILAGQDVLGVMPTGAGKSLCYQIPALIQDGLALVVSPLISLMKDQVGALQQAGVGAAFINSSLSAWEQERALREAAEGRYKLLYVAPERLGAEGFLRLAKTVKLSLVAIDEAHCISHWGHDFRPSYLKIAGFIASLNQRPPIAAFTATATGRVREDISRCLQLRNPLTLVTGFNRPNLKLAVQRPVKKSDELLRYLRGHPGQSGIIYCATRKTTEDVCTRLCKAGLNATRYHAGLSEQERRSNQDDFLYDRATVMVATNAFGMGIDKSNVSFVLHYNMPKNLEAYYQEAGRAGRDGEPADCIIYYSASDVHTARFLVEKSGEESEESDPAAREARIANDLELLKQMTFYCTTSDCLRSFILRYFGERAPAFCGSCGNCLTAFEELDITIDAQKIVSCVIRVVNSLRDTSLDSLGQATICDILRGKATEKVTRWRMEQLSTFGIMADTDAQRIRQIMDYLVDEGYLALTAGRYPALLAGPRAADVVRDRKPLTLKLPKDIRPPRPEKPSGRSGRGEGRSGVGGSTAPLTADEEILFEKLREERRRLADAAEVPAYVIFTNASLREMSQARPTKLEAFLDISGVGANKAERYGERFCKLIAEHLQQCAGGS
ncbi:MAG: DNA helicase RecQ [Coriobacteriales bacterium]|jgi:ATP-dependent DNA helicase RecQ|nr:DNA helicase RecQ [Coriobacteriales bacterium]